MPYACIIAAAAFMCSIALGVVVVAQERKAIQPRDASNPLKELISGYYFLSLPLRAMQDDDFDNPGYAAVAEGERLWGVKDGLERKACADCHRRAADTMGAAGGSYPKFYAGAGKVVTLEQRVNLCRQDQMGAEPWDYDAREMKAMTVFVRGQARGTPVNVATDGEAASVFALGQRAFESRIGQLNISCADCHNARYGQNYGGDILSQGHGNGYPAFSVGAKSLRSLHERFRACNALVRAAPLAAGSDEYVALELYLAWRAAGLPVETPAVRP
jgi:sulfur-oxidizing protein SoxA